MLVPVLSARRMPSLTDILLKCLKLFACCFCNPTEHKYENLGERVQVSFCVGNKRKDTTTSQTPCAPNSVKITKSQINNNVSVNEFHSRSKQCSGDASTSHCWQVINTNKFRSCQYGDVIQFHDESVCDVMRMIKKAIDKDQLRPIDQTVKYTSSAVDTITMFIQIQEELYKRINLQDIGKDTRLITMIIDDLSRCCVYYVDEMFRKIDYLNKIEFGRRLLHISEEWCYGINSATFIEASLNPFVSRMRLDEIRGSLSRNDLWKSNLFDVIDKTSGEIERKISLQLEMAAKKMSSTVMERLFESLSNTQFDLRRIVEYLSSNLLVGKMLLDSNNFDLLLQCCWLNMLSAMPTCMNKIKVVSLQSKNEIIESLATFMRTVDERQKLQLKAIDKMIPKLEGGTNDYIHLYYITRLNFQKSLIDNSSGLITVKAHFSKNDLLLEILTVQTIVPSGKSGLCKMYVKINFLPKNEFENIPAITSRIHKQTTCLTFDEKHSRCLSPNQYSIKNAMLQFTLKKCDGLKVKKKFMAEAFMLLSEISRCETSNCLCKIQQSHFTLNHPITLQCYPCQILKQISGKKALKFLKKEEKKIKSTQAK